MDSEINRDFLMPLEVHQRRDVFQCRDVFDDGEKDRLYTIGTSIYDAK